MSTAVPEALAVAARTVADLLLARNQTVATCESSVGGLLAASLLTVPGASAYFLGGAVIYTLPARVLIEGAVPFPEKTRGASEGFVRYESAAIQARLGATWGLGETGASGPAGNRYGDPAGHAWVGVAGPDGLFAARNVLTGDDDRERNMVAFGVAALELLADTIRGVAP